MGIKPFRIFLQKYAPKSCFEIPLDSFRGKRIAIDMNNLIYIMMSPSIKEVISQTNLADTRPDRSIINLKTLDRILFRLEIFMQYGITPVCVFDGVPIELKKNHIGIINRNTRNKIKARLLDAEQRLYSTEPLFRNQHLINEYEKYYKQDMDVDHAFIEQLKDILKTTGFPVICAEDLNLGTNDAEAVCAALCIPGNDYCIAAATMDADFHVYGGNIAIKDIEMRNFIRDNHRIQTHYITIRSLESILNQTGLSFDSFQDLCILMGTDFNPNIPNIGPVKSWNLIQQHKNISAVGQCMDISILKYPEVKKVFNSTIVKINISPPDFNLSQFYEHGRDTFNLHGLKDHTSIINRLLQNFNENPITISIVQSSPRNEDNLFETQSEENMVNVSF